MQNTINHTQVEILLNQDVLTAENLLICQKYFTKVKLTEIECTTISNELARLFNQVYVFAGGLSEQPQTYFTFLYQQTSLAVRFSEEAELLEWVIPAWSTARGKHFAADKPVDEFYRELELLLLWQLICLACREQEFSNPLVTKMRVIIRRYSNMPALWQYLCNLSGEEIKSAYTF